MSLFAEPTPACRKMAKLMLERGTHPEAVLNWLYCTNAFRSMTPRTPVLDVDINRQEQRAIFQQVLEEQTP